MRFYGRVGLTFGGMLFYKKLQKQKVVNKDTFILFQRSEDEELITYGDKYLEPFVEENKLGEVVILTANEYGKKLGASSKKVRTVSCPAKKLDGLISLYCMIQFTRNILIFSTDKPVTNRLSKLIETQVLTKEEAVAIGIYGLGGTKGMGA